MKPSMASDIWSDSDVSLMGTFLYYIDEDWENLHAMLIGCTGFTGERQLWRIASLRLCQTMSLNNIVLPHFLILD